MEATRARGTMILEKDEPGKMSCYPVVFFSWEAFSNSRHDAKNPWKSGLCQDVGPSPAGNPGKLWCFREGWRDNIGDFRAQPEGRGGELVWHAAGFPKSFAKFWNSERLQARKPSRESLRSWVEFVHGLILLRSQWLELSTHQRQGPKNLGSQLKPLEGTSLNSTKSLIWLRWGNPSALHKAGISSPQEEDNITGSFSYTLSASNENPPGMLKDRTKWLKVKRRKTKSSGFS